VALVKSDVSEESIASIIKVEGISEIGRTLALTNVDPSWIIFLNLTVTVPSQRASVASYC
jgi:hypothetical protein